MTGSTVEPVIMASPARPAEPAPTIVLDHVTVTYAGADRPSLRTPLLRIGEGQLVLVTGPTGSGKSTLLRVLNGLVPHFSGGTLAGRVVVDGRDTRTHRPRELAGTIGLVQQLPAATFVADTVEEEIAYGMETLAVPPSVMRRRVEETLDLLGLGDVRHRRLRELSGGQQQRVAIAAVLAAGPRVLVLDEPTSALDPVAAEDVLSSVQRLVHDLGLTVVLAEHRLERVIHHADAAILVRDGVAGDLLAPAEAMRQSPAVPPVIALGHALGWSPLPLSVREARRAAASLRTDLAAAGPAPQAADDAPGGRAAPGRGAGPLRRAIRRSSGRSASAPPASERAGTPVPSGPLLEATDLVVRWGRQVALAGVDLTLQAGEVSTVMGRNGAGKSTLLWALAGAQRLDRGRVRVDGRDPRLATPAERARLVGLVPQDPADLLYAQRVVDECRSADQDAAAAPGTTAGLFAELVGPIDPDRHPRDLSEGQRLALALAVVLAASPPVLLLDEPTRGLDYAAKSRLIGQLRALTGDGHAIVLATHDVELAAEISDRIVLLADGEDRRRRSQPAGPGRVDGVRAAGVPDHVPGPGPHRGRRDPSRGAAAVTPHRSGTIVLVLVTIVGLVAFFWPFVASAEFVAAHGQDAPWLFALLVGLLGLTLLAELSAGTLDAKAVAVLGVLGALGGGLRVIAAGTAGIEPVYFLVVLAGRVLGRRLAFLSGALILLVGAFLTGGVGPWLPFQMIATGWVALGAALLPPLRGRGEVLMLAAYGLVTGLGYGALMNLWFWPFVGGSGPAGAAFVPGADLATNLGHYAVFYLATSLAWDAPRGITTALLILLAGSGTLATFRRALRRAHFDAQVTFAPEPT